MQERPAQFGDSCCRCISRTPLLLCLTRKKLSTIFYNICSNMTDKVQETRNVYCA